MIPAAFEYERAGSVDHAVELLAGDDAKLLAGGQSLIPVLRLRFARPSVLVDVGRLDDLRYVREDGDRIAIGALTRHAELVRDPVLARHCAVIPEVAAHIGDPQVRHRGTIGGSVAHADPAGDLGTILLTLDAELVARGPEGERTIPATEFFTGPFETTLRPQEMLTEIRVPAVEAGTYLKHVRRSADWATVGVAAARVDGRVQVGLDEHGDDPAACTRCRGVARRGRLSRRRRRAHRRGHRSARRYECEQRVPRAPRAGARPARARTALSSMTTVAVLGLGEAGSRLAADLAAAGVDVRGYDPARAGAPDPETAVAGADVVLSVNSASAALGAATAALSALPAGAVYADLNTAAPELKRELAALVAGAGGLFADVALLGPVPARGLGTPALASGEGARAFADAFRPLGMPVEVVSAEPGDAATMKLLRSVFMKGIAAAAIESLEGAEAAGHAEWLRHELAAVLGEPLLERLLEGSRAHAARRTDEMEAACALLRDLGIEPRIAAASASLLAGLS